MRGFWRNISYVLSGAIVAQLIPILASLVITRLFVPDAFGEHSVWLGGVLFISIFITLRLEATLVLVENSTARAKAMLYIVIVSAFTFLSLSLLIFVFYRLDISYLDRYKEHLYLLIILSPAAFFLSLNLVWQSWAVSEGRYRVLNVMRVSQATLISTLQVASGLYQPDAFSLSMSYLLANIISLFVAIVLMPRIFYVKKFSLSEIKEYLIRYKNFPKFSLPADAVNSAAAQLPVLIVAYRFGADVAGFLALTMRVLGAPIGLVGKAVLDVFKKQAVDDINSIGNCKKLYVNTFMVLSLASLFLVVCTIYLGEYIFETAFGREWKESGLMAIWLLPMFALRFVASPLSYMVYIVEKQHVDLLWQVGLMFVTALTLLSFSSYQDTLIYYALAYALMYCIYLFMSYRFSKGVEG